MQVHHVEEQWIFGGTKTTVENSFLLRWRKEMNKHYCALSKSGLNLELRSFQTAVTVLNGSAGVVN